MKVQLVTPYRVSHLHRYGVTVRGDVTSVYPPYGTRRERHFVAASCSQISHEVARVCAGRKERLDTVH